ncbi:MAG: TniB family NTP-binding protein [Idiomarina sp.]
MTESLDKAKYSHLNQEPQSVLDRPLKERINYIRSPRWIGHPTAQSILTQLEDLIEFPRNDRMKNLLIYGESNAGKSMIARRFQEKHTVQELNDEKRFDVPVLLIQAPPTANENRLYGNMLDAVFAPFSSTSNPDRRCRQLHKILPELGVKVLVIDEFHAMLNGPYDKQRQIVTALRLFSNDLKIPIVGLGTASALRVLKTDSQLDTRFRKVSLPRWVFGTDFRRLLVSFERMLPLKEPSGLSEKVIAKKIFDLSEGVMGEVSDVLIEASVSALRAGKERIDMAQLKSMNWDKPSDRRVQK